MDEQRHNSTRDKYIYLFNFIKYTLKVRRQMLIEVKLKNTFMFGNSSIYIIK